MSQVIDEAFGAKPPRYKVIQELDRKVRNWHIPPVLRMAAGPQKNGRETEESTVELTMQRLTTFAIREMSRSLRPSSPPMLITFHDSAVLYAPWILCASLGRQSD